MSQIPVRAPERPSQRWLKHAAVVCGTTVLVLDGFVLLFVVLVSPYSLTRNPEALLTVAFLVVNLALAGTTIALGSNLQGVRKGVTVWILAQLMFLLPLLALTFTGTISVVGLWVVLCLLAAACAGNRVLRERPDSLAARLLAGLAGVQLLGALLVILVSLHAYFMRFFPSPRGWGYGSYWPMMFAQIGRSLLPLALLALAGSGILSAVGACRERASKGLCRAVQVLSHVAVLLLCGSVVAMVGLPPGSADAILVVLVWVLVTLAPLYLSEVALADCVHQAVYARESRAAAERIGHPATPSVVSDDLSDPVPVEPIRVPMAQLVPGRTLEERLENLYKMREDGLVDEVLYQAWRRQLVEEAPPS